jgi:hypothetical protein
VINQGIDVPENTIAVFFADDVNEIGFDRYSKIVKKPDTKRDWFDKHFYNCLPLTIANQQGFVIVPEFGFNIMWDGGNSLESISITYIITIWTI